MKQNKSKVKDTYEMAMDLPEYYTPEEIQEILRIGRTNLYKLLANAYETKEQFIVRKICGMYRIEKKSFCVWLEQQ